MATVLSISVPFFTIIFLGMFTRAIGFFQRADARTLSKFAFYVTVPPMLFVNLADKKGWTPLHPACNQGNERGKDQDKQEPHDEGLRSFTT